MRSLALLIITFLVGCGLTPVQEEHQDMRRNDDAFLSRPRSRGAKTSLVPDHAIGESAVLPYAVYDKPLNGSFEVYTKGYGYTPDHWDMRSGSWNSEIGYYNSSAIHDTNSLQIRSVAGGAALVSESFPLYGGSHFVSFWFNVLATGNTVNDSVFVTLEQYDSAGSLLGSADLILDASKYFGATPTGWKRMSGEFSILSNAKTGKLVITKDTSAAMSILLDVVRIDPTLVQPPWSEIPDANLSNSWVYFGAPYNTPAYLKDTLGFVHLKGLIKNGSAFNAVMYTLPAGYRPVKNLYISTVSNNLFGVLEVKSTGEILCQVGSTAHVSWDNISFLAEN